MLYVKGHARSQLTYREENLRADFAVLEQSGTGIIDENKTDRQFIRQTIHFTRDVITRLHILQVGDHTLRTAWAFYERLLSYERSLTKPSSDERLRQPESAANPVVEHETLQTTNTLLIKQMARLAGDKSVSLTAQEQRELDAIQERRAKNRRPHPKTAPQVMHTTNPQLLDALKRLRSASAKQKK